MLYLRYSSLNASPKAISGRTSYLRVRLEFHRYPHLIRAFFNRQRFGPPRDFTHASPWTWVGHTVSGLQQATIRPIKTRFPFGFLPEVINLATYRNSLVRSTKSTRSSPKATPTACKHRVSGSISLPSRGSFHLSLTVLFSIGHWVVFSLRGWSPYLPTGFHVSRGTPGIHLSLRFRLRDCYSLWFSFPADSASLRAPLCIPYPLPKQGLGSFPFARRYLENRVFFLFLRVLRCFSSPSSLHRSYFIHFAVTDLLSAGFPHSDICDSTVICT